jgi:hypothetical protein
MGCVIQISISMNVLKVLFVGSNPYKNDADPSSLNLAHHVLREFNKLSAKIMEALTERLQSAKTDGERDALTLLTMALKQLTPRERVLEHERGQIYLQCDCSRMDAAVGE